MTATPPFNPAVPSQPQETRRFATMVVDFLNRPVRNEFTVAVPIAPADASLGAWTSGMTNTPSRRVGWSPSMNGMVLRRVRLASATAKRRANGTYPSAVVSAYIQTGTVEAVVGSFSLADYTLDAANSRVISGARDLNNGLSAGVALSSEITYSNYPPVDFSDTVLLYDIGIL